MSEVKETTPEELERRLENNDNLTIIDVREDEEVEQGMIEGAKHIPLGEIPESLDNLDKEENYVLVCRSGARSMRASAFLKEHGYKVENMAGGMLEWKGDVKR
ncbi:rhodanese-like domain-containing protein [Virgibacillus xinjiangensis]|uniref:Rhodanese-like domain-containing protein n=1 Tax=Virgibacillus xinjiangensis TaxID=393090 RepID=A0ABV7CSK7_9BACI